MRDMDEEIDEAGRQWELDHPDGVISDEEDEAMCLYAMEACREEGCHDDAPKSALSTDVRRGDSVGWDL
jgi:hypothetical protein